MSETADIVVIGGGIIGCSVVYHLSSLLPRSTRILLLDAGPIAGGTSGRCMGHLMVTPDSAREYELTKTSIRLWSELADEVSGFEHNPTGALYLADSDEDVELLSVLRRQFVENGDRADVLDPAQLRDIEPGLAEDIPGALFYPGDGVLLPMAACREMLRAAIAKNPSIAVRPGCAATGFDRGDCRLSGVRTRDGTIACGAAVLATGVWTPEVAGMLGLPPLPIHPRGGDVAITAHHTTPVRKQILEVSYLRFAHGAAQADPTKPGEDPGGHAVNLQPQTNGGCLIGSTRQFRGMSLELNRALLHRSLSRARRYCPSLATAPIVRTWAGLRPYSIDKRPLIGAWPGLEGCHLAAGHEGLGVSLAQVTGLLVAQQIAGHRTAVDASPYDPGRFAA
ncbi:MAG: FAD-dependent oxidoreductase [Planctomycetota bacterium]